MRVSRYVLACVVLFVVALAWNGLVHLVLLRGVHAVVRSLLRPNFAEMAWLSLLGTAAMICLFVAGWNRFARSGSLRESVAYGVGFAVLAGILVDLNQYVLYPIPAWVAATWFAGGLVEFTIYGLLVRKLYPSEAGRGA